MKPSLKARHPSSVSVLGWVFLLAAALATSDSRDSSCAAQQSPDRAPTRQETIDAMHRAVAFFRQHASAGGGYVFQLSEDGSKREGEGKVGATTAWIEPPATPSVGMAYLRGYQLTADSQLLEATRETADALVRGQLQSGGWDNKIEFGPAERSKYAYRVDAKADRLHSSDSRELRNLTTFDDDKSQSAVRFLMQLDRELEFEDESIHEATRYALNAFVKAQFACGAWPQRYQSFADATQHQPQQASIPPSWPREYPGTKYTGFHTLNDNTISDLISTMLDAWEVYGDRTYLESAQRGGEFLLRAQLPMPQPGWAQQYDEQMQPAWARKFEPPAVTGGESQGVMRTLIELYRRTAAVDAAADRFLEPLPRAITYYRGSLLPDGRLARFYELGTNRPLFFTKDYELTYSPDDLPTHYGFIVKSRLDQIAESLEEVRRTPVETLWNPPQTKKPTANRRLAEQTRRVISSLDERGAWVEEGRLRYHGDDDPTRRVIRSDIFIENLQTLASWIAAQSD